jgi:hypothetical protein
MKIKSDFITNSSSASFYLLKKNLTQEQLEKIRNHISVAINMLPDKPDDWDIDDWNPSNSQWVIKENKKSIRGRTELEDFDMYWFLIKIGIKKEFIEYEGEYH